VTSAATSRADDATPDRLHVDYCGEVHHLLPGQSLTLGRDADVVVDDNPFLHRRIVELFHDGGFWWVANVGTRLSVTVSGGAGSLQSLVGPGARVPIVLPSLSVLFTAGETTYEVLVGCDVPAFTASVLPEEQAGDLTLGAVALTSGQFLVVLALAEQMLRRVGSGPSELPSNARAAERLGVPITTFNRKLDTICDKFSRAGVRGLRGGAGQQATQRRVRLVEYAVSARVVRPEHLPLLDHVDTVDQEATS
jgi:hypothetical protein